MNKPTPIYKDHTGQWREQNPNFKSGGRDKEIEETKAWHAFEQSITYHPFPDAPETKQGEVVMARLQWQCQESRDKDEWSEISEGLTSDDYMPGYTRQIWVAVTDSAKEEEEKELVIDNLTAKLINAAKYGYVFHQTTQFPELSFNEGCRNNFLQYLQAFESPSATKVESAEEEQSYKVKIQKDIVTFKEVESNNGYSLISGINNKTAIETLVEFTGKEATYLHDKNRIIMAMEQYATLQTSSLQRENDKLRDLLKHVRLILPNDKPITKTIDEVLNKKP